MDNLAFEKRREQADYTETYRSVQEEIEAKGAGNAGPSGQPVGPRSEINKVADPALDVAGVVGDKAKEVGSAAGQWGSDFLKGIDNVGAPTRWAILRAMGKEIPVSEAAKIDTEAFLRISNWPMPSELRSGPDVPGGSFAKFMAGAGALGLGMAVDPTNYVPGGQGKGAAKAGKMIKDMAGPVVNTIKSEKDLKGIVDAPGGQGKTYAILTDNAPKLPVAKGFQPGNLEQLIRKVGPYEIYKVKGSYEGVAEDSIMIVSSKPDDQELLTKALRIAKAAGQESIATNKGILFPDGSLHPRTGPAVYGQDAVATQNYSVVQTEAGELPFTTPVDWGSKKSGEYRHDYTGIAFSGQRHMTVPPQGMFLNELPKGLNLGDMTRFQNEVKIPGMAVYDFSDNHLNLPEQGYEETLKSAGYRAAITYGTDGMPSLHTFEKSPVSRVIERSRAFKGPETGVDFGAPKTVFPAEMPARIAVSLAEGKIDPNTKKDLVQIGAAMLAQPEMTSAKVAADTAGIAKGEKGKLATRVGKDIRVDAKDNLTHEDIQDALAYLTAEDQSSNPAVRAGWEDLIRQIEAQFEDVGKQAKIEYVDGQPYASAEDMVSDFKKTGILKISKDFNEHPVFTPEQNLKFRAVHDYKGHIEPGHDFSMAGESGTFKSHADTIQGEAAKNALRTEVLGQASAMLARGGKFQKQKIFDLAEQRKKLGLVEGASTDLFGTWMKAFEQRLPDEAKGKISLEQYRDLFNDSVKAYTKHLDKTQGEIPNTKTLLGLMNDSHGQSIKDWYNTARPELERLFGPEDADLMAKLIAVYSPQADVKMNVDRAFGAFRAIKLGEKDPIEITRRAGVSNAEKYTALWHNVERVLRGEEISGRKVANFLDAINGNPEAVVIDRHMAGMFGYADASADDVYSFIEDHIRLLARESGVRPAEAQAILWGSWKATKGQADELMNLDQFVRDAAKQNPDLLYKGHGLNQAGVTRLQAAWLLARVMAGGAIGGTIGDDPGERLKNALIGVGLGALTSKPVIQKIAKALRENMPAKWFKPAGQVPAPVTPRVMTPEETMAQASEQAAQKARIDMLRNKPKTVTVGDETYELDMKSLDTPESIKQAVDEMARVYQKQLQAGTLKPGSRGVIPNALAKRLGEHLGLSEDDVLNRTRGSVEAVEHVFAYADILDAAKARALTSMELYSSGVKAAEEDFVKDIDKYVQVGYQLQGLLEELGRGLQAAGVPDVKALTTGFKGFTGPFEILRNHGSINGDTLAALVKETGLEKAANIGKAVQKAGLWDMVAEVTYGFTLSNPRSTLVNVASSGVLNPILTVMTRNIAETFGDNVASGEARAMMYGYFSGVQRMMRAVGETYKKEGGVLNLLKSIKNVRPVGESALAQADKSGVGKKAITGENVSALMPKPFQFDPTGWLGRIVDAAGSAIRTPSMLMELGDHFSYAVNYDMAMHARAFREGVKQGKEGTALDAFIAQELANPSPSIRREAEDFAKHEIFKQMIEGNPGKIVEGLNHPAMRPFITFVRTPVNIFRYNLEGVPVLNLALKGVRDDIAAGGARRDLAMAKMTLGGTLAAIAGMMADNDRLTGAGPDNYKLRSLWLIDHKPYSVKLPYTDQWVSYKYFDPVSAWYGLAADAVHFMAFDKEDLTTGEAAMSIVLGLARNFADKTYTRDTFEFLDQLTVRPGENANTALESFERYTDKKITTYVPFSSLSRAARNAIDPAVREAFTLSEKLKNTIPGWSMVLPEKLDFYGDPIVNPRTHSLSLLPMKKDSGDQVTDELLRIRANVGMPPKVVDGEDLGSQEYHDLVQMRGKGLKEYIGKDLREALIEVFNAPEYNAPETTDAMRRLMVEKTVEGYTQAAMGALAEKGNQRFLKYRKSQKRAEELSGQKLNLNFGAQ